MEKTTEKRVRNEQEGDCQKVERQCKEDCQEVERRCWPNLPLELMDMVATHCSISDLAMLRAICTSWQTVGKRICRSISNYIGSPTWFASSTLITIEDECCSFYNPLYNLSHTEVIPEVVDTLILGSMHGWLILARQSDPGSAFLFNITTKIRVELPRYSPSHCFTHAWLSSPPNSPDCYIICMEDTVVDIGIIRRGEENWTYYDSHRSIMLSCTPTLCQGKLYCMDKKGRIAVFDPNNLRGISEFAFEQPQPMKRWKRHHPFEQNFLVDCEGELLAIFLGDHETNKVSAFALNPAHGTWKIVRSLGDHLLFISKGSSLVEKEKEKGTADKIYLPKFTAEGDHIIYDFAASAYRTRLVGVCDPNSTKRRCRFIKEVKLNSAWYRPAMSATCTKAFNW